MSKNYNHIIFNKPFQSSTEQIYIQQVIQSGKLSGSGVFTRKCELFFENKYNFKKVLLTSSCTDALEMASILANIKQGDEVIVPSYTFVSSANPFVLRGAKIIFADSEKKSPNIDSDKLKLLITKNTKAIVVVHYAGIACDMDKIMAIANANNIVVIEDAAHSIDACYKNRPLGSIGHLATFSFHETKNITCGEGGMLVINDEQFIERAEIIREKGTNRTAFNRGEVNKYEWVDVGSSFLMSEINAAFLFAQIENLEKIQEKRLAIWNRYYSALTSFEDNNKFQLPQFTNDEKYNAHLFFIVCNSLNDRNGLITFLKSKNIQASFHYGALHKSKYYTNHYEEKVLPNAEKFANCLIKLPLHYYLSDEDVDCVVEAIKSYYM